MKIRAFDISDIQNIIKLISSTYRYCNHTEYFNVESREDYLRKLDDINYMSTIFSESKVSIVAELKNQIIGVIRGDSNRIFNLFVDPNFQNQGVGQDLLMKYESSIIKQYKPTTISIRSSLFAVEFYKKNGYKQISEVSNFKGLKVINMEKHFKLSKA